MDEKFFSRDDLIKIIRNSQEQLEMQEQFEELLLRALEEKSDAEKFRIPKKVKIYNNNNLYLCPTCNEMMLHEEGFFCPNCGQALDWTSFDAEVEE